MVTSNDIGQPIIINGTPNGTDDPRPIVNTLSDEQFKGKKLDPEVALKERLKKSPPTKEEFIKKCNEIAAFVNNYDFNPFRYSGRTWEVMCPTPPPPAPIKWNVFGKICKFLASILNQLSVFLIKLGTKKEDREVVESRKRIESLMRRLADSFSDENIELNKCWVMLDRLSKMQVQEGETKDQAIIRTIRGVEESFGWVKNTPEENERLKAELGNRIGAAGEGNVIDKLAAQDRANILNNPFPDQPQEMPAPDGKIVSPELPEDPILEKAKEMKLTELLGKKNLTEWEVMQLKELIEWNNS